MPRALTVQALASLNEQETDEVWLPLVTIAHEALADPIRAVANPENVTSRDMLFVGLPFELTLPDETEDGPGEVRLRIDNVDRMIVDTLREINTPPTVTVEVILASQPDTVELSVDNLTLRDARYDVVTVEGVLRFEDLTTEPIAEIISPERFPGLFTILGLMVFAHEALHGVWL